MATGPWFMHKNHIKHEWSENWQQWLKRVKL
jgi:hypothetical protein